MDKNDNLILELKNITKVYPGVTALNDVSVAFRRGEIHAIVGENGAGKSTLIKVITGAIKPEAGSIVIDGHEYAAGLSSAESRESGIEAVYQEYNLIGGLSAAENVCLGKKYGRLVDFAKMNSVAGELFERFGVEIDPSTKVSDLPSAKRQIVEICKAMSKKAKIIIFDEPTAPLSIAESNILLDIIRTIKSHGGTVLYITHRLTEVFDIADRVSVFRDGKYIVTRNTGETSINGIVKDMVGRELSETYPPRDVDIGETVLKVENLTGNGVKNVSFELRKGEILGFSGLVGAGRTEILKVLYGAEKKQWGKVTMGNQTLDIRSPKEALQYGIGMVPEDRKREGCVQVYGVGWNIVFSCINKLSRFMVISKNKERSVWQKYIEALKIKTPSPMQAVMNLSGGNQQKVVMARTLAADADIIILDEPTRGIDVGAKREIYLLMRELCRAGKSIIMVSSEMEELLGMCDRLVIFHERTVTGEIDKDHFDPEYIILLASGLADNPVDAGQQM